MSKKKKTTKVRRKALTREQLKKIRGGGSLIERPRLKFTSSGS